MIAPRAWRSMVAAFVLSAMAVGSLAAGARAGGLQVTFEATFSDCVRGIANGEFTLRLRDGTDIIDTVPTVTPNASDRFDTCFAPGMLVRPGRNLKASGLGPATGNVVFTIPTLSLRIDRVTDVVRGSGPAGRQLQIRVRDCFITQPTKECPFGVRRTVTVDGSGHYSRDLTGTFNLRGLDEVRVRYTSAAGHTYSRYLATPSMWALVGEPLLFGQINPGRTAHFRLYRTPGGAHLSTRTRTGEPRYGDFVLEFAKLIKSGRQVKSDFASDARLTIPDMTTTFEDDGGVTRIRTRCFPGRKVRIDHDAGQDVLTANSQGRVNVLLDELLPSGTPVHVYCQTSRGDIVELGLLAP